MVDTSEEKPVVLKDDVALLAKVGEHLSRESDGHLILVRRRTDETCLESMMMS